MGLDHSMQLVMSGVLNVTQLVGVISSLWTMDKLGRRPLLLSGSILMTVSQMIISILVGKFSKDWPGHRAAGWISVAFLLFYMLSFGATWGPVPWAMPSEVGQRIPWLFLIANTVPGISLKSSSQGCCPLDMFKLAQ